MSDARLGPRRWHAVFSARARHGMPRFAFARMQSGEAREPTRIESRNAGGHPEAVSEHRRSARGARCGKALIFCSTLRLGSPRLDSHGAGIVRAWPWHAACTPYAFTHTTPTRRRAHRRLVLRSLLIPILILRPPRHRLSAQVAAACPGSIPSFRWLFAARLGSGRLRSSELFTTRLAF